MGGMRLLSGGDSDPDHAFAEAGGCDEIALKTAEFLIDEIVRLVE